MVRPGEQGEPPHRLRGILCRDHNSDHHIVSLPVVRIMEIAGGMLKRSLSQAGPSVYGGGTESITDETETPVADRATPAGHHPGKSPRVQLFSDGLSSFWHDHWRSPLELLAHRLFEPIP
jgi:hypothetical protein